MPGHTPCARTFVLPVSLKEEGRWHVASCPLLDVASQGRTRQQAVENLREALELFLETCREMGTLEEVLRKAGLGAGDKTPRKASEVAVKIRFREKNDPEQQVHTATANDAEVQQIVAQAIQRIQAF